MISSPALVKTIEQLSNHIKSLYEETQSAGWRSGEALSTNVRLTIQQEEEVKSDTAFFTKQITEELNRLTQNYSPETELTQDNMQGLRQLLEKRDSFVVGKWLDYLQATRYPMTAYFVGIAQILESVYQIHWFQLLMPKLTTVSAGVTDYNFSDSRMLLWHFIRSEAGDTAIDITACFEYALAFGEFYHIADQCTLMTLSEPPAVAMIPELLRDADAAYVKTNSKLFYLHKTRNECNEIPLSVEQLEAFNASLQASTIIKTLSKDNLNTITAITHHSHVANKPKPLTEEEQTRLINHSYVTYQCGKAIQELYKYKHERVSLGGILNAVIRGLRDDQLSSLWKKANINADGLQTSSAERAYEQCNSVQAITIKNFKQWLEGLSENDRERLCQNGDIISWAMEPVYDVQTIANDLEKVLQADLKLYDVIPGQQTAINIRNYDFLAKKTRTNCEVVFPALRRYDYNVALLQDSRYSCLSRIKDLVPAKPQQSALVSDRNSFFASELLQDDDVSLEEQEQKEEEMTFFSSLD